MIMEEFYNNKCDYIRIDKCEKSDDAVLVFSHIGYPIKKFAMTNALKSLPATKIYINCHQNSWYQKGIEGVTKDIAETIQLLREILEKLQPNRLICVGMSMGAYAALLFGLNLECDFILAFTPEIMIGEEYSRSFYHNNLKEYDYQYIQLSNLIRNNKKTQIYSIYGVYDTIDLSFLWLIADVFLEKNLFKTFFVSGDHTVTNQLDVYYILKTLLNNEKLQNDDIHQHYVLNQQHTLNELLVYREIRRLHLKHDSSAIYELLKNQPSLKLFSQFGLYLGNSCIDLKKYEEAKVILHEAANLDPYSHHIYHALGILYHSMNELNEAKIWYEKALEIRPYAVNTRYRVGCLEIKAKNYKVAENHLKKAVELSPEYHEAHFLLGKLYQEKEMYIKAKKYYCNAAEYDPENLEYLKSIKKVESMLKKLKIKSFKTNIKNKVKVLGQELKK